MVESSNEALATAVREARHLLVVTGAGISLASGIPTFRGSDRGAVWKRDITEMATLAFFLEDPVESWRWYLSRFACLAHARPNAGHLALADLERWQTKRGRDFLLVTQNIDTLHAEADSRRLIEVHGTAARVRCPSPGCRYAAPRGSLVRSDSALEAFRTDPRTETLPGCPECQAPLRPHVLWFDELYSDHEDYRWEEVLAAGERADLALFVGTSFSVGVTDLLLRATAMRGVPVFSLDPGTASPPFSGMRTIQQPAEEALPELVRLLESGG